MELLQVFDENKKMLKEKVERSKKKELPNGKYFMIILLFIQNDEGKFLMQKTSKEKNSVIATTGGHVTYGDDAITTVIKEANEELGIKLDQDELIEITSNTIKNCHVVIYYCHKNLSIDSLQLQKEEVESVAWLTKDEIDDLIKEDKVRTTNIEPYRQLLSIISKNEEE